MLQRFVRLEKRSPIRVACDPSLPLIVIFGNRFAVATPIRAPAAWSSSSEARMSGRWRTREEGRLMGSSPGRFSFSRSNTGSAASLGSLPVYTASRLRVWAKSFSSGKAGPALGQLRLLGQQSGRNRPDHSLAIPTQPYRTLPKVARRPPSFTRGMRTIGTTYRRETTCSISSRVVVRPRLKRMAPIPISGGTFIAFNTGESSTDPEWQAEPVEAATPSKPLRIVAPICPQN